MMTRSEWNAFMAETRAQDRELRKYERSLVAEEEREAKKLIMIGRVFGRGALKAALKAARQKEVK